MSGIWVQIQALIQSLEKCLHFSMQAFCFCLQSLIHLEAETFNMRKSLMYVLKAINILMPCWLKDCRMHKWNRSTVPLLWLNLHLHSAQSPWHTDTPQYLHPLWQQGGLFFFFIVLCNNISISNSSFCPDWAQTQPSEHTEVRVCEKLMHSTGFTFFLPVYVHLQVCAKR